MPPYQRITVAQAKEILKVSKAIFIDIRDRYSYDIGHTEGAINIGEEEIDDFINNNEKQFPVLVICYHGNNSQMYANYLSKHGFEQVYSIDGGYEAWVEEE
mgnify:FL=1